MKAYHFSYDLIHLKGTTEYEKAKTELFKEIKKLKPDLISMYNETAVYLTFNQDDNLFIFKIGEFKLRIKKLEYFISEIVIDDNNEPIKFGSTNQKHIDDFVKFYKSL